MKKREWRRDVLANGTGGGTGNQSENLIGGESSGGQPVDPVPGPAIIAGRSSDSKAQRLLIAKLRGFENLEVTEIPR